MDEQQKTEETDKLARMNRVLLAIRNVNQIIARTSDKDELLQQVCETITSTQGYFNCWIALFDDNQKVTSTYQNGLNGSFSAVKSQLLLGDMMSCAKKVLAGEPLIVTQDPVSQCKDCPLSLKYEGRCGLTARIGDQTRTYGIISASIPSNSLPENEDVAYFEQLADDIAHAIHSQEIESEQQQLLYQLELSSLIVEMSPAVLFRWKAVPSWPVSFVSKNVSRFGYSQDSFLSGQIQYDNIIHPDDRERVIEEVISYSNNPKNTDFKQEYRILGADKTVFYISDHTNIERNLAGQVTAYQGIVLDITEQHKHKSQLQFQASILKNIQDLVTVTDMEGNITYVNDASCQMLGKDRQALLNQNIQILGEAPEKGATQQEVIKTALNLGEWRGEIINIDSKGCEHTLDCRISTLKDINGKPDGLCGISTDISRYKEVENALKESEQRFRAIFDNAPAGIALVSLDFELLEANPAYLELLGRNFEELTKLSLPDFTHPDDIEENIRLQTKLGKGEIEQYQMEKRFIRKDGTIRWGYLTACLLKDADNQPVGFLGHVIDITELKQANDKLQQSQKLEAIGHLAGGIAHDFNNLLGGIMGYSEILKNKLNTPQERRYTEKILTCTNRAADLTQKLLAFARKGQYESRQINLHHIIEEVVELLEHTVDKRIEIFTRFGAASPLTLGDPTQIQSVILNLGINACDAMEQGGKLSFTTDTTTLSADFCKKIPYQMKPGNYITVAITDTGTGIPEEILPSIFEPFFTTKEIGKGTGMGLAAAYGAIKNHEGAIDVESKPGAGTTFTLYLPFAEDVANTDQITNAQDQRASSAPYKATILVVDDEPIIRDLACELISGFGYNVVSQDNGEQAADYYEKHWQEIDLVILDMIMPKLNGVQTYEALRRINPDVNVIIVSGYSIDGTIRELLENNCIKAFIQKPFESESLALEIASIFKADN